MGDIVALKLLRDKVLASGDTNEFYELAVNLFNIVEGSWKENAELKAENEHLKQLMGQIQQISNQLDVIDITEEALGPRE